MKTHQFDTLTCKKLDTHTLLFFCLWYQVLYCLHGVRALMQVSIMCFSQFKLASVPELYKSERQDDAPAEFPCVV